MIAKKVAEHIPGGGGRNLVLQQQLGDQHAKMSSSKTVNSRDQPSDSSVEASAPCQITKTGISHEPLVFNLHAVTGSNVELRCRS